jgi:NodT family efflux transporter outer membrane factor (OMF) lipoprotein
MRRDYRLSLPLALLLAGCSVGDELARPDIPAITRYSSNAVPTVMEAEGVEQRIASGEIAERWWEAFGSAKLNNLITEALKKSPTLEAAQATLRQAESLSQAKEGSLYPRVDAALGAQRQGINGSKNGLDGGGKTFNLLNASVSAGYTFDLSGGNRRQLEALAAKAGYQRFQLAGARLMQAADIATTAIGQAQLTGQITAMKRMLTTREEQLAITRERLRLGAASSHEVLAMEALVEQTRAALPALRHQLNQTTNLLALLAGQPPDTVTLPSFTLQDFTLPPALPLRVPSELVRVLPDIQASEALIRAANADFGAAAAKSWPQITLGATTGSQALTTAALFGSGSLVWGVAGQLVQPLFNKGTGAEKDAAKAGFDAAAANYRQSVLKGLREVADVLSALDNDARRLSALAAGDGAAQGQLTITASRYQLGAASYLELLQAQGEAEQLQLEMIAAEARRLSDSVAFYQAMGGGRIIDVGK